jgi:hypothetical protein
MRLSESQNPGKETPSRSSGKTVKRIRHRGKKGKRNVSKHTNFLANPP